MHGMNHNLQIILQTWVPDVSCCSETDVSQVTFLSSRQPLMMCSRPTAQWGVHGLSDEPRARIITRFSLVFLHPRPIHGSSAHAPG